MGKLLDSLIGGLQETEDNDSKLYWACMGGEGNRCKWEDDRPINKSDHAGKCPKCGDDCDKIQKDDLKEGVTSDSKKTKDGILISHKTLKEINTILSGFLMFDLADVTDKTIKNKTKLLTDTKKLYHYLTDVEKT